MEPDQTLGVSSPGDPHGAPGCLRWGILRFTEGHGQLDILLSLLSTEPDLANGRFVVFGTETVMPRRSRGGRGGGGGGQNGGDGRACAWEAATTIGMAWPASPVATECQGNPCSTGIRWGVSPAAQMGCLRNKAGAHQGQTSREGEKDIWWMAGTTRGGTGHLGLTHTEPQRGRLWTARGQRRVDSKNSQTTLPTTSTSSIRQLLGAADAQTAHHATFSTAPTHQILGSANAETTSAGAPAAAADRKQQPDATCEGKNG